ncbi:MAG: hypothetical protein R2744_00170 [Bacteroidales bacterium]
MIRTLSIFFLALTLPCSIISSQSVVNTVHNLSATGPGIIKASSESEICIFCHTPHSGSPVAPLWNRNDPGSFYILYNSTTTDALPGQPDGASLLCLSCHDGTIALGNILSRVADIDFSGGVTIMPPAIQLTTDLADDHQVSFANNAALAALDRQLERPCCNTPGNT